MANQTDLQAIVIDFIDVKHADLSGLLALKEVMDHADKLKLAVFLTNVTPEVQHLLTKSNIHGANISECSSDLRDMIRAALMASTTSDAAAAEYMQVESLGLVQELLRVQSVSGRSRSNSQASVTSWSAAREQHTSHRNSHLDSIHSDSDSGRESEEEGGDKGGVEMKDIAATVSSSSSSSAHGRQNYSKVLQQGEQGSVDLDV